MIASIQGTLRSKTPTEIVIETGGIGYLLNVPLSTYEKIGDIGSDTFLHTFHYVREDTVQLFGFHTSEEKELFKLLLTVSGVGPKAAQAILSGVSAEDLRAYLLSGNVSALLTIPGIGKKTAERLVVELRDKISRLEVSSMSVGRQIQRSVRTDAITALIHLGFTRSQAEHSVQSVLQRESEVTLTVEELVRHSLKNSKTI